MKRPRPTKNLDFGGIKGATGTLGLAGGFGALLGLTAGKKKKKKTKRKKKVTKRRKK